MTETITIKGIGDKLARMYIAGPTKSEPWTGYIVTVQDAEQSAQGGSKPFSLAIATGWAVTALAEWHATGEFPWLLMSNHLHYRKPRKPQLEFQFGEVA